MSVSKTITYKTVEFHLDRTDRTLQSMLATALKSNKAAISRSQSLEGDASYRLINYNSPFRSMRVGELIEYTRGHKQPLARIDPKATELDIMALSPPGKDTEFVHSILYFGVKNNHVLICQSSSIRSRQLEDYLNWLFRNASLLEDDQFVILADQPPLHLKKAELEHTKGIEFSAPVKFKGGDLKNAVDRLEPAKETARKVTFKPLGGAWEALKSLLPPEIELPKEMSAEDLVMGRELEVKLEVSWKRARKDDPSVLLDTISNQLRHIDTELDYSIVTRSGATISKDDLKLKRPISVGVGPSGFPRRDELWSRMHEWLNELIESHKVVSA